MEVIMRRLRSGLVLATLVMSCGICLPAEGDAGGKAYNVIEILRLDVNREDYSSKEAERAGRIPDEILETIQRILISEYSQSKLLPTVRKTAGTGEGEVVLELGGKGVDWL